MEHKIIVDLGYKVTDSKSCFRFIYKGHEVVYWKKKKWFSGKSVEDGRGIENLISQLKNKTENFDINGYTNNKECYNHLIGIFQKHINFKLSEESKQEIIENMKTRFIIKPTNS